MSDPPIDPMSAPLSPRMLAAAPHRLLFFIGAGNLLVAMAWWTAWLAVSHWTSSPMPQPPSPVYAGWLHAFVMQYQVLPSFFFGFLLTTFPKWTAQPDLPLRQYAPVGIGLFGGQILTLLGAFGWAPGIALGLCLTIIGWGAGLLALGSVLWHEPGNTWHARSCFAALTLGLAGLLTWAGFILGASPFLAFASIKLGTFGLLLPVYVTVAHRMFPFFASRVVVDYRVWRPMWLLGAIWPLCLAHLAMELTHSYGCLWLADVPIALLTAAMLWRWWPRGDKPGLLTVLFAGFGWLPLTFVLYSVQSVVYLATDEFWLGRGPAHALFIGFFGSVLIAMVTRVTQGHSGRPLYMPVVAWFAFVAIQMVAVVRISAELLPDPRWQVVAAIGWLVAFLPWVVRIGRIYLQPRADGQPG